MSFEFLSCNYQYTKSLLCHFLNRQSGAVAPKAFVSRVTVDVATASDLELLDSLFGAGLIDEARAMARQLECCVSLVDAKCIAALVDAERPRFIDVSPSGENLITFMNAGLDEHCEELIKQGARLPPARASGVLLRLFGTRNMHRTVASLIERRLIPMHLMTLRHLEACIDTPYVGLTRKLAKLPAIVQQYKSLPNDAKRAYKQTFFYWCARAAVLCDIGCEQLRALSEHVDLSALDEATLVGMLRRFGNCWNELGVDQIRKTWTPDGMVSCAIFRPLRDLVLRHDDAAEKIDYVIFSAAAKMILSLHHRTSSDKIVGLLSLSLPPDDVAEQDADEQYDALPQPDVAMSELSAA